MNRRRLTQQIKRAAYDLGFSAVAVAPATAIPAQRLETWLQRGFHGRMGYMERNREKRLDVSRILAGAASVVSVALNYHHPYSLPYGRPDRGAVSRYASGDDYHDIIAAKLRQLLERIGEWEPAAAGKAYVDTGPVMDKEWASRSGIGWLGKHTNVLRRKPLGSWFFLGEIILDVELAYDRPVADHCGSCTACIDACPTDAIVQPYLLDSRLCISYLTIELRDDIPEPLRSPMDNLIFGCDICQDVCPWNREVEPSQVEEFAPRSINRAPELRKLARLTPEDFRREYSKSPVKRTKWRGFLRNVAVALGNAADPNTLPELRGLLHCDDSMVRRHAAWALHRIGGSEARRLLQGRLETEEDDRTREYVQDLLSRQPASA